MDSFKTGEGSRTETAVSGIEQWVFERRKTLLVAAFLMTLFFLWGLGSIQLDSSMEKYIPTQHPYVQNFLRHQQDFSAGIATLQVVVEARQGDIFTKEYFDTLKQINDELFFIEGVNRSALKSLWTPNSRWTEVTEEGFQGGPVIPSHYESGAVSDEALMEDLRHNVLKSGLVGRLVANNFKSSMVQVPLLQQHPDTGDQLDYRKLSRQLENRVREAYSDRVNLYITGTPKKLGDLLEGATVVGYFFVVSIVLTSLLLYLYTGRMATTLIPVLTSLMAVIWQLGALSWLGMSIDLYSMLVPFLVFAIAISHGVQIVNTTLRNRQRGMDAKQACRHAFRVLYLAGTVALISDAIGFLTLLFIDIGVIQELALSASIGVAIVLLTNLIVLPLVLSYWLKDSVATPLSDLTEVMSVAESESGRIGWHRSLSLKGIAWLLAGLASLTRKKRSAMLLSVSALVAIVGAWKAQELQIGDLNSGAPELRPSSVYNQDNDYIVAHYSASSDVLVVMVETAQEGCVDYQVVNLLDRFMWTMENQPGVQSVVSLATVAKLVTRAMNEGNWNWYSISRNQTILNTSLQRAPSGMINSDCSMTPVLIYLNDHKAETLKRVIAAVEAFKTQHDVPAVTATGAENPKPVVFQLASGNAGIEAATNDVIDAAQNKMLMFVYAVVFLLCWLNFRSLRAVACILAPLMMTSVLAQALMAALNIGVKVATLPVIALGVGIGVDYGIYVFSRLQSQLKKGLGLEQAYLNTLKTTGKAVCFTGLTLAIGVGTWMLSPIQFQADMGILLTFMFLLNMLGALTLLPALAAWLLPDKLPGTSDQSFKLPPS